VPDSPGEHPERIARLVRVTDRLRRVDRLVGRAPADLVQHHYDATAPGDLRRRGDRADACGEHRIPHGGVEVDPR
jgi:hypothetical protein